MSLLGLSLPLSLSLTFPFRLPASFGILLARGLALSRGLSPHFGLLLLFAFPFGLPASFGVLLARGLALSLRLSLPLGILLRSWTLAHTHRKPFVDGTPGQNDNAGGKYEGPEEPHPVDRPYNTLPAAGLMANDCDSPSH